MKVPYHLVKSSGTLPAEVGVSVFYTEILPVGAKGLHIIPSGLLEETVLRTNKPTVIWQDNLPCLYFNSPKEDRPDLFSAAFYMASRYEEYLPFAPDTFGRFPESASLSGQNGFTHLPVVHLWAMQLALDIKKVFPAFYWEKIKAKAIFTYDIDVAFAYRGRNLVTHTASFAKDLATLNISGILQKIKSGFGSKSDPSDTYNLLENNPLSKLYFFLLADKRTKYDRNISPKEPVLKQLIRRLTVGKSITGIHPSYCSSDRPEIIFSEKKTLQNIVNQEITISRQHFLRFRLPQTYRYLQQAGIQHDFSMQYPEMPGFRAGLCIPYPFFDLSKNEQTALILHPGCIMETTFRDDLHLPANQSWDWYLRFWEQVQQVGGEFISIWHNDTLWEGLPNHHPLAFRQVHNKLIEYITTGSGSSNKNFN